MLVNFCDPILKPIISSSGACHEGHDIRNLISHDTSERQRGYLGYGSPPSYITIQFLCHVKIKQILINPKVRSKKSQGFEILSKCSVKQKQSSHLQTSSNSNSPDDDFERVGSIVLSDSDSGVIFYNKNYKPTSNMDSNFACKGLFRSISLGNCNCLRIKIFKAVLSVPAIGKLEVWGEPGLSCSRSIRNHVYKLWHQKSSSFHSPSSNVSLESKQNLNVSSTSPMPSSSFEEEPPEEFIDPISCKMMVLPFILPSGKVVDSETLENHKHFESINGRQPSDPFTGICFTVDNLPIPDHDLKRRIDRFLSENCHNKEYRNIPRTTGRNPKSRIIQEAEIPVIDKLSDFDDHIFNPTTDITFKSYNHLFHCDKSLDMKSKNILSSKLTKELEEFPFCPIQTSNEEICDKMSLKRKSCISELEVNPPVFKRKHQDQSNIICSFDEPSHETSIPKTHEQLIDESLNSALKSALQGLPSFVKSQPIQKPFTSSVMHCNFCNKSEMLFKLPCKHFVCRTCLSTKIKNLELHCDKCQVYHSSCDIERYHCQ